MVKHIPNRDNSKKIVAIKKIHEFLKSNGHKYVCVSDACKSFIEQVGLCGYTGFETLKQVFLRYPETYKFYISKGYVKDEEPFVLPKKYIGKHYVKPEPKNEKEKVKTRELSIDEQIEQDLANWKVKAEQKDMRKKFDNLLSRYNQLRDDYETLVALKEYTPADLHISPKIASGNSAAVAIVQYSDWHVDEMVRASTVNYKNEYNPDIARKRAVTCIQNTLRTIKTFRHDIKVDDIIVQLGGDFIGGYIHPELEQTNSMSPLEAIRFASELLINGINFLADYGDFKTMTFVCNRGNHSRITKKVQSNDYAMNLEQNMYYDLANRFKDNSNMKFVVSDAEVVYVPVFDKINRFFHGHQVKSQGGIGGIGIPLYKQLHRWDASQHADYNFMCDKHTYSQPTENCNINGSLKGWDAYAIGKGFKYQEPLQSLQLLDNKRGYTIRTKIICE